MVIAKSLQMRCSSLNRPVGLVVADKFLLSHAWISPNIAVYCLVLLGMNYFVQVSSTATSWHKEEP
jgi:hypothetical protein